MRTVRSFLPDVALTVVVGAVGIVGTAGTDVFNPSDRTVDAGAFGLVLVSALALLVRRRWPLLTLAVAAVSTSAYLVLAYPYGPIFAAYFVAVYTAARYLAPRRSMPASAAAGVGLLAHLFTHEAALDGLLGLIPGTAWTVVPFAIGVTVKQTAETRARDRADAVSRQLYEERLRIAQEVHDVVGHGLTAIKMHADVALHLLAKKPEQAEVALTTISRTSTDALDELRATLAMVRSDGTNDPPAPSPGLERLGELCDRIGEAGLDVRLEEHGRRPELSAAVDLAGYRVVQEALTNVLRHSETRLASVHVTYDTDAVVIAISNPGGRDSRVLSEYDGLGIPGMRQRVTTLGGTFSAGHTASGRFEVHASIPIGGTP